MWVSHQKESQNDVFSSYYITTGSNWQGWDWAYFLKCIVAWKCPAYQRKSIWTIETCPQNKNDINLSKQSTPEKQYKRWSTHCANPSEGIPALKYSTVSLSSNFFSKFALLTSALLLLETPRIRYWGHLISMNWSWVLQLMNNKEVKPPVLVFGTEQVQLLEFDSQVNQRSSSSQCSGSETLRVPIARYCLRSSGSEVRMLDFLVKS